MLLAGDIGGTKTSLALFSAEDGPRAPIAQKLFCSGDYPDLGAIAREYIAEADRPVARASFAVAGPVIAGRASLTNLPWVIEESALASELELDSVSLLNDVEAMATAVPYLQPDELRTLQTGDSLAGGSIAVIAPGTGLGEAYLTWDGSRYRAHPSEGSHANFGPSSPRELRLLQYLKGRWGRVSYGRVCGGRSIPDLYDFLRDEGEAPESAVVRSELATVGDRTPTIMAAAFATPDPDPLCLATVNLSAALLGARAGDLALTVFATGGLYVGGGLPQRILPVATGQGQLFLSTLRHKGRLTALLARLPVHVIVEPVGLLGAALHGLAVGSGQEREGEPKDWNGERGAYL
jgi:glucokinase